MVDLNALVVEDSADDAELLVRDLRVAGYDLRWTRVETEEDFLAGLQTPLDIIFSDFSMPQFSGMRALELLRESGRDVPLLLISGTVGEDLAVAAMRIGATDYILKDRLARLPSAVERALSDKNMRAEARKTLEALRRSDQRLRSIVERTMDCIMVVMPDGRIGEMNAAGLAMLQAGSLAEISTRPFVGWVMPPFRPVFTHMHQRVLGGASELCAIEVVGLRGRRRWLEIQAGPLLDMGQSVEAAICITRDITERKLTEEQIRAQLAELQRWRTLTLDREERILALKAEVNALLTETGRSPRYASDPDARPEAE